MIENLSYPPDDKRREKDRLIHDIQTFLWQLEQGGYTRETMAGVLSKLKVPLLEDGKAVGGAVQEDVERMVADCERYISGEEEPRQVVWDLDRLRRDLEES